ncbi:MAG: type I-D CRISPR-associated helicase Cas3' [Spirulina sp.]
MKIELKPLFSQLNAGIGNCPLGCETACKVCEAAPEHPKLQPASDRTCPLSLHQAQTYAETVLGDAEIIFNTSATGDGKSLAAYLPGLLEPKYRILALYPTIELIDDQETQLNKNLPWFKTASHKKIDSLYGAELARRASKRSKGRKFNALVRSFKQKHFNLTNPDIAHYATHDRYKNLAFNPGLLRIALASYPHLYLCDEFHIFGVHQETAILNSLILIRNTRSQKSPLKVIFTSATPNPNFIDRLKRVGFRVRSVEGSYQHGEITEHPQTIAGYRQINQKVELEFVELKDTDSLAWLSDKIETIRSLLRSEKQGRGLIILNSVAVVNRVVSQLQELLGNEVEVREISGRIDRQERIKTREELAKSEKPVLIIATSAVDVGVDFDIHLLIFEASNSATFVQRLGRLGRHRGYDRYKAFALIPGWMRWVVPQLQNYVRDGEAIDRDRLRTEIIERVFSPPQNPYNYERYLSYWGALQTQGMLYAISGANIKSKREREEKLKVTEKLRESILADLRKIYQEQLDKKRGHWWCLGQDKTGQAIQDELLRFRGSSDLQAAVWESDRSRFYTYDLLRLLPHAEVEVIDRKTFLEAAEKCDRSEAEFPEIYIQVYLKIKSWNGFHEIDLECDVDTEDLDLCLPTLIKGLSIEGHPQSKFLRKSLKKKKLLAFLVPLSSKNSTIWTVRNAISLSPNFGLYHLTDSDGEHYACAFNQDALLLEAIKWKLRRCDRSKPYIL